MYAFTRLKLHRQQMAASDITGSRLKCSGSLSWCMSVLQQGLSNPKLGARFSYVGLHKSHILELIPKPPTQELGRFPL